MSEPNINDGSTVDRGLAAAVTQALTDVRAVAGELGDAVLRRADLVTREEFEVQRELLAGAQQKIASLNRRIDELEQRLHG